jgi:hypothetical protein
MIVKTKQIVDEIRLLANIVNNNSFTDTDITRFVNDAKDELFDLVVSAMEHYFIKTFDFTLTAESNSVELPNSFYKQNRLDYQPDTQNVQTVEMLSNYLDRNQGNGVLGIYGINGMTGLNCNRRFQIADNSLEVLPNTDPNSFVGNYRLYYTYLIPDLAEPFEIDLSLPEPDITVEAATHEPLDGDWSLIDDDPNQLLNDRVDIGPLFIDGQTPIIGKTYWFFEDDAPIDSTTMGAWEFTGLVTSGSEIFHYTFARVVSLDAYIPVPAGYSVNVNTGTFNANTQWRTDQDWTVVLNSTPMTALNYAFHDLTPPYLQGIFINNGPFTYANLPIGSSWIGAVVNFLNSPTDEGVDWEITNVTNAPNNTTALLNPDSGYLTPFSIPSTAIVEVFFSNLSYELPAQLYPWKLYIVVHAAKRILDIRQMPHTLEEQLARLTQRVIKMSNNRTESITQAPWSRRNRGGYGGI